MNTPPANPQIKTNQLDYFINHEAVNSKYDIFCVSTTDTYFKRGAMIIDAPVIDNKICAVCFDDGNCFFALMHHESGNKKVLMEVLQNDDSFERITIAQKHSNEVMDHILLQLLLNSIGTYNHKSLSFNNLTGKFLCYHPKWLKHSKLGSKTVVSKVACLELKISPECRLQNSVRTFSSELLKNYIRFDKKKFEDYPQYVLSAHNTLRRKIKGDTDMPFIMRQTTGDKSEIAFLKMGTLSGLTSCKVGIITAVLEEFNRKFSGIARMNFTDVNEHTPLELTSSEITENEHAVKSLLSKMPVNVVDCIGNAESQDFCVHICHKLFEKYEITAFLGDSVLENHLNIRLIHDAEYYKNLSLEDPYKQVFENCIVQHITYEKFYDNCQYGLSAVVHELLMKQDLLNGQITLFDWRTLGYAQDLIFGMYHPTDEKSYIFMKVHPNGTFMISEQKWDPFQMNEYSLCMNALEDAKEEKKKAVGAVEDSEGNINLIHDTGWYTIPEYEKIRDILKQGIRTFRGKEKRDELFFSCLDIKYFKQNGEDYYFAGTIGAGMNTSIHRAANIRKVEAYDGSQLLFPQLLPLMNITFVRNQQLTVIPFPFKYMREYWEGKKKSIIDVTD